ncbi:MAG: NfeD family protein [Thermodesulfobacteriota bacterium]
MESLPAWLLDPRLIWFIVGLALLLAEFAVPGLVIFFFGLGAWVVVLVCFLLDLSLVSQLIIFLVASLIFLLVLRRKFQSLFGLDHQTGAAADGLHDYLGKRVIVTREIKLDIPGKVEYNGTNWNAVADVPIEAGATVEIVGKDNITFKVIPV